MRNIFFLLLAFCATAYGQTPSNSATNTSELQNDLLAKPLKVGDEFPSTVQTAHPYNVNGSMGLLFEQEFYSKNSSYIKLYFKNFDLAPGDYVEIRGINSGETAIYAAQGKIVDANGTMINEFWSQAILDERIVVRLYSENASNHYGFDIDRVAYGYPQDQIDALLEEKSICGGDEKEPIICYNGTTMFTKGRAVCRLLMNGNGLCTGWLLGSEGHLMTNNHCIGNASTAANTDFLFDYYASNCSGSGTNSGTVVASSATFIKTSSSLDYTLVKLPTNPTGTYGYLQLSNAIPSVGDRIYIVGHPGGRRKEITVKTDQGGDANGNAIVNTSSTSGVRYYADTEGGSSGSPVFDYSSNLVIAIHNTGGCTNGSYGRCDRLISAIGSDMPNNGVGGGSTNPPSGCSSTVSSFPYTESFESNFGAWTNASGDDFNWTRRSGGTPSNNTGPSSASNGSQYIYMESSSPNYSTKRAILNSPCFNLTSVSNPTLSFRYHMYGASNMGNLSVQVSTNGTSWTTVWTRSGNQGNSWQTATISLNAYTSQSQLRVRFNGVTGTTWQGDMAVDYVQVTGGSSSSCVSSYPYTESFESNFGAWSNATSGDDFNWTRRSGGTPSNNTGPSSASNGSFYAYMESSAPNYSTKRAILNGPCADLRSIGSPTLSFRYHMYGSSNMGNLSVQVSTNGTSWTTVWSRSGNQGNSWQTATISLNSYTNNSNLRIRFNGVTGTTWQGDMAIDYVRITGTPESASLENSNFMDEQPETTLSVSPNPFDNVITINAQLEGMSNYRVMNLQGQVVRTGTFQGTTIPLEGLGSGVYLLTITNGEQQFIEKIIRR